MSKPSKFYAVKVGRRPGIYYSWPECEKQIKGYSGAQYKSFKTEKEAKTYLYSSSNLNNNNIQSTSNRADTDMTAYVDGSFNSETNEYSAGVIILFDDQKFEISKKGDDPELVDMRNVAGEIMGAEIAMNFALEKKVKSISIYYDYAGIEKWCTNEWAAKKAGTKKYKEAFEKASKYVQIRFVKVKAHSGNIYNEEADQLAKKALSMSSAEENNLSTNEYREQLAKDTLSTAGIKTNNELNIARKERTSAKKNRLKSVIHIPLNDKVLTDKEILDSFKILWKKSGRNLNEITDLNLFLNLDKKLVNWEAHTETEKLEGIIPL